MAALAGQVPGAEMAAPPSAWVPQDPVVLSVTVAENILLVGAGSSEAGAPVSEPDWARILAAACLTDDVARLPDGLGTDLCKRQFIPTATVTLVMTAGGGVAGAVEVQGEAGFGAGFGGAAGGSQEAGQGPVRLEPGGRGGDGGTQALLHAGGVARPGQPWLAPRRAEQPGPWMARQP
jgi:hypothetical protein